MKRIFCVAWLVLAAGLGAAAEREWTGQGGNRLWSNPGNWSPAGVPQNGEALTFPGCVFCGGTVENDLPGLIVGSLYFRTDYTLNGNALTLMDYIAIGNGTTTAAVTLNLPIILGADCGFHVSWGDGVLDDRNNLYVNGPVNLNGHDLEISASSSLIDDPIFGRSTSDAEISGAISGAGNVNVRAGRECYVSFRGTAENTFTGGLTLWSEKPGYVRLEKQGGVVATNWVRVWGGTANCYRADQVGDLATLIVSGGELNLNGFTETVQNVVMLSEGLLKTGAGALTVMGNVTGAAGNFSPFPTPVMQGRLSLPNVPHSLIVTGATLHGLEIQAEITGAGGFEKRGSQAVVLSARNTFTGNVSIREGLVEVAHSNALGSVAGVVSVEGGGVRLNNVAVQGESLFCNSAGLGIIGVGNATWGGPMVLNEQLSVYGENLTLSGPVSGPGGLMAFGLSVTLSGTSANTFTGPLQPRCEQLFLGKSSGLPACSGSLIVGPSASPQHEVRWLNSYQLPANASVTLHDNALLSLNNSADAIASLTFTGGRVNLAADGVLQLLSTLTANPTNVPAIIEGGTGLGGLFLPATSGWNVGDGTVAGPDLNVTARVMGRGFNKTGDGTLALGGNNTFAEALVISNGIVRAESSNALGGVNAGTTVHAGATLLLGPGAGVVREPVTLNGAGFGGTNGALAAAGTATLSNAVVLASPSTIRVDGPWLLRIDGTISGAGPLTKSGAGALTLAGTANNTFSGDTLVAAGTLGLDKADFFQAVPGNLVIGTGGFFPPAATARHFSHDQIWANVTLNGGGLLDLNGHEEYLLAISLNEGGDVQTGTGLLTLEGNLAGNSLSVNPGIRPATSTISGRLGLRTGNHNLGVAGAASQGTPGEPELNITAAILNYNGIANLHKNGSGALRLAGANTFAGTLNVNAGTVIAAHNSAFGSTQGSTTVQGNGAVALEGDIAINEFLLLDSADAAPLRSSGGTNLSTGAIQLLRPACGVDVASAGGRLQLLGRLSGPGGLTKSGAGTLEFFGPATNDYAGLTIIANGLVEARRGNGLGLGWTSIPGDFVAGDDTGAAATARLRVQLPGQFNPRAGVRLNRSGRLELSGGPSPASAWVSRVEGDGGIDLGANTLLVISNAVDTVFAGSISGTGALNKRGAATLTLSGGGSFSGPATNIEGTCVVHGEFPNCPVTVSAGALSGDGAVSSIQVEAFALAGAESGVPGRLGGELSAGRLTLNNIGFLSLDLFGPHPTGGNDSFAISGPVNLSSFGVLSPSLRYAPREGEVITLIRKLSAGPISGTLGDWVQGSTRILGGIPVHVSYTGGDGNDLTLTVTNLAAGAAAAQIVSGNGNGLIEPDECNLLFLGVQNRRNSPIKLENVLLRSLTPGALVTIASADYPDIPAASTGSNMTPFQVRTLATHPCGAPVALELQATVAGEGTFAIPFTLLGGTDCANGGGACESCTLVGGAFSESTPALGQPLIAAGEASICFPEKPCPGADLRTNLPPARFIQHSFTNTTGRELCLTAQLRSDCPAGPAEALHAVAYLGNSVPSVPCERYLGDSGAWTGSGYAPFSFRVPAGSNFVLVVTTRAQNFSCASYGMELFGLPCPLPRLEIARDAAAGQVRLQWSTAYPEWRLQSRAAVIGGAGWLDGSADPFVPVRDGRFTVTNRVESPAQFYRLSK